MNKIIFIAILLFFAVADASSQIYLSPVNCGDCVADRIHAKRTAYVDELNKKFCNENNPNKANARKCIENGKMQDSFAFFTDRCSESDFFIGINGIEVQLKRITKKTGQPHYFVGSYAGEGVSIAIVNPRLVGKTYDPEESRKESDVINATYKVDVMVKKGKHSQLFKNVILTSGL